MFFLHFINLFKYLHSRGSWDLDGCRGGGGVAAVASVAAENEQYHCQLF